MSLHSNTSNGLVCFTNCLLPQEDGSLLLRDLWIDEQRGVILDAQRTFFLRKERPDRTIDLSGNILSPGFLDIQINGAYGFDFSVYDGDDAKYQSGLKNVSANIVETGVTSLVPTIITQEKSMYPKLLSLLRPYSPSGGANLLGWHAEGPFLQLAKRGAHAPPFILSAPDKWHSFEAVYGEHNLAVREDWEMDVASGKSCGIGVRMITAAPEIDGVMDVIEELTKRGVIVSIGHSIASSDIATRAVQSGARLITHLFNAMPQLHHRDPSIIGLLGASPHISPAIPPTVPPTPVSGLPRSAKVPPPPSAKALTQLILSESTAPKIAASDEALSVGATPPMTPTHKAPVRMGSRSEMHLDKGHVAELEFERPFYGLIVDGIHSHPNSVRLAYTAHQDGCVLITDAMPMLDPHLRDGVHDWRDGKRLVKEGVRLYIEGTDTLAGSVVTMDTCVRNFARFTGCSLGEAIKCATYNPAKCLNIENCKGTLRPGADADFVVLDRQGRVVSTWVRGIMVWTSLLNV
ncbi:Metallo-dependent hydrolase [Rickenella mellea]|uniref:Metallo-dependent hydrolase n=1 Tax=Rickenella mellea TaxID=50990 RepID=A0A4Y7PYA2_9AGAM|nr:Metallo-dependent hydrolase [Rickenella mellea]